MDIKITSITSKIMKQALDQALEGRKYILSEMKKAISKSRQTLAENAPKIKIMNVKVDKIKEIIGPSGKVIKDICESTSSKIDIEDSGKVTVFSPDSESLDKALKRIHDIIVEPEMGVIYNGKVVKTVDFGAFVNFLGNREMAWSIFQNFKIKELRKQLIYVKREMKLKLKSLGLMIEEKLNYL